MGDVDGGGVLGQVQPLDFGAHGGAKVGVERAQRLVHQKGGGSTHERARERHALAVAAGEAAGPQVHQMFDLQQLGHVAHALPPFGTPHVLRLQRKGDVVAHGHVGVERKELEDKGDVAVGGVRPGDVAFANVNRAVGHRFEAGDHAQRGRLAAARWAEQHDKLAVVDREVDGLDGVDIAKFFLDLVKLNFGH